MVTPLSRAPGSPATGGPATGPVLRIGVLGCADIAERKMLPALLASPLIELVAVASRTTAKAQAFATRFGCAAVTGYDQLLVRDDIDAVYIPLPAELHAGWTLRALRVGKHVLSEKPFAASYREAAEAVALAEERGLLAMESFMFLHHSQHREVQRLVADGAIGKLRAFTSDFAFPPLPTVGGRYLARRGQALLEVGVYPIRAAQLFLGESLTVRGAFLRVDPDRQVDVAGSALLVRPDGVTAQVTFGFEHFYRSTYALWGSEGRISLHRAFTTPDTYQPVIHLQRQDRREELTLSPDRQFENVAGEFARTILERRNFRPQHDAVLRQAALIDAVRTAADPAGAGGVHEEKEPSMSHRSLA